MNGIMVLMKSAIVILVVFSGYTQANPVSDDSIAFGDTDQQFYIVQAGDTLTSITRRFYGQNITSNIQRIFQSNRSVLQSADKIYAGQKIILPGLPARIKPEKIASTSLPQPCLVKAMTFNIRVDTLFDGLNGWSSRRQSVINARTVNGADVIGLQEGLYHQVDQIQQALPLYRNYAAGRNDGNQKGESCVIFYRKDRFILDDFGTFWFSDTPSIPGSKDWGNLWPRICSWVHLIDKCSRTGFYVYNVHLDNFSQNSRTKSIELLTKRIVVRKEPDPFILMGDFNMEEHNSAMLYLQNVSHQKSHPRIMTAWQSLHSGQSGPCTRRHFIANPSSGKIDHIAVEENTHVLEVNIDRHKMNGKYPSDHFPVVATISLAAKTTANSQRVVSAKF